MLLLKVRVGGDGNFDAVESGGFTVGGHIDYSSSLTGGAKTNVAIHEMGHAVGLAHRETEDVLMNGDTYDDVFDPDPIDYQNLLVLSGSSDRAGRSSLVTINVSLARHAARPTWG